MGNAGRKRGPKKRARGRRRAGGTPSTPPPIASRNPRFEAISLLVAPSPLESAPAVARKIADRAGLKGWRIEAVPGTNDEFELTPPGRRKIPPGTAWKHTYRLRDEPDVVHAEPLFAYDVEDLHATPATRSAGGGDDPATAGDFEWSLRKANVIAGWDLFGARPPGAGVTVGHPDTGYTPHPELA